MTRQFIFSVLFLFVAQGVLAQSTDVVDVSTEAARDNAARIKVKKVDTDNDQKNEKTTATIKDDTFTKNVEKIEVTGSYVRRIDVEGPSPVVTFDQENFNNAGVDTVSDYLRESPLFGQSNDSGNRDGYFRFRGQHAGSTLVLINGMRVPKLGGPDRGFYSGVEAIPTNIIERVEVLKDGSSALYGSDAMAGVMNFITRKDFDGAEFSTRINVPEINRGIQQNHTIAFGKSYSRGSWFLSTQYVEQKGYTEADIGNYFSTPFRPATTNGEVRFSGGANNASADIEAECNGPTEDGDCPTDNRGFDFVRDPRENLGTLLTGQVNITSDLELSAVALYNRRTRADIGTPFSIEVEDVPVSALGSNALQQQASGNDSLFLRVSPLDEIGTRQVEVLQNSLATQTKLQGYFYDSWSWNLSGSYSYSLEERDHRNGLVTASGVRNALTSTDWNPLALGQNSGALSAAQVQATEAYESSQTMARLMATGELFEFSRWYSAGGPVSIAFGMEQQWETTSDVHDEILLNNQTNLDINNNLTGSRFVNSFFTEFVLYPLQNVEVQLAGRYDRYSDFGETTNPKVSVGWRPSNKALFRASWGTNFNAPSVRNMIAQNEQSFERFSICPPGTPSDDCDEERVLTTRYRDNNLKPETGVNYNIGTVIQPNKSWTFTVDQWNFEGEDTLAQLSGGIYSDLASILGEDGLSDAGVTLERNSEGELTGVRAPLVTNTGFKTIRGVDIGISFNNPVRILGKVLKAGIQFDHTHMIEVNDKRTQFAPVIHREDLEWKNTLRFSLNTQNHGYQLAARTVAGDTTQTYRGVTRTHTEYDFNYNYRISLWPGKLSFGVKNLLNSRTPTNLNRDYIDYTLTYNAYAFQPLGRRYYVGYSHSF